MPPKQSNQSEDAVSIQVPIVIKRRLARRVTVTIYPELTTQNFDLNYKF